AVPRLDARRRVAAARPPPPAESVGAVMKTLDLTELQRVEDQAAVAFAGEPRRVMLVTGLRPIGDAVDLLRAMPADVEDRREESGGVSPRRTRAHTGLSCIKP